MLSVVAAIEASEKKVDTDKDEFKSEVYKDIHISKACVQDKHPEDAGEVIAQAVKNAITKPPSANVKRHCANAGCNSDQTTTKLMCFLRLLTMGPAGPRGRLHILTTSSRLNSCRLTVDSLSIDTHDQIEYSNIRNSLLYRNPPLSQWRFKSENILFE